MSYIIKLPTSDSKREVALSIAKKRKDSLDPSENVISTKNSNLLDILQPSFLQKIILLQQAKKNYRQAILDFNAIIGKLKSKSAHGLLLVKFKIIDKDSGWSPSTFSYYKLPLDGHLPPFTVENEIINMAINFIRGETLRVAAGGMALKDIKKQDVEALLNRLVDLRLAKQVTKDALIAAQLALSAERKIVNELIESMWGDIEHASQDIPKTTANEFNISWGVKYVHLPDYGKVNIKAEDADTQETITGVNFRIGKPNSKGGAKKFKKQFEVVLLRTKKIGNTHLIAEHPLYETTIIPIKTIESETIFIKVKMKKIVLD